MSLLAIDFEFNRINDANVNLICCVTKDTDTGILTKFWLSSSPEGKIALRDHLQKYDTLLAYSAVAECRSFISLGLDPTKFKWVDMFLEFRCLTNHNDKLNYGKQLVGGRVVNAVKPKKKWDLADGETNPVGFKHTHSLAEATYKLLGEIRDTEHKDEMRDLIISDPDSFTEKEKHDIVEYCAEDVIHLPRMWERIKEEYKSLDFALNNESKILTKAIEKGKYAAYTAIMESRGYPLDFEKAQNFSKSVSSIIYECQLEINQLFPDIKPFRWNKKTNRFSWDQIATRGWIKTLPFASTWDLTDGKDLSLSLDAFTKFFDFKHNYPSDNLGAQFVRYLKLKQSLNGFVPAVDSKRKCFWDYVGADKRVRPYMNIYGSQSSRSQPSATGFMMLKPAWTRVLVQPSPGMAMASIDYGSEEFFISALASGDQAMIDAYLSGDVYLAYAKEVGAVPKDATKESHKKERDDHKAVVLAMSYMMSKYGLAIALSSQGTKEWTTDEAQDQIDTFYQTYPDLKNFQDGIMAAYEEDGFIELPCGWYLWGDNDNHRSVTNCPIQGLGASIMRKAVELAFDRGLYVAITLHDALYIEYPVGQEHQISTLMDCMREAFMFYFPDDQKELASKIKMDPFAWSPDYQEDSVLTIEGIGEVECSNMYIDPRAKSEYDKFNKYFYSSAGDEL